MTNNATSAELSRWRGPALRVAGGPRRALQPVFRYLQSVATDRASSRCTGFPYPARSTDIGCAGPDDPRLDVVAFVRSPCQPGRRGIPS